jgi:hypothetical protein
MFFDWGTYHFHLGMKPHPKSPGFVARTDELLFAITHPREDKMYLIDVHSHKGAFENQNLMHIIQADWPEILADYELKGLSSEGPAFRSDTDVKDDRQAGLTSLTSGSGGNLFAPPGGGITTAGTSAKNQLAADQAKKRARSLQEKIEKNRSDIEQHFKESHNLTWDDLEIRLTSISPSFAVTETRTGEAVPY